MKVRHISGEVQNWNIGVLITHGIMTKTNTDYASLVGQVALLEATVNTLVNLVGELLENSSLPDEDIISLIGCEEHYTAVNR